MLLGTIHFSPSTEPSLFQVLDIFFRTTVFPVIGVRLASKGAQQIGQSGGELR